MEATMARRKAKQSSNMLKDTYVLYLVVFTLRKLKPHIIVDVQGAPYVGCMSYEEL